MQTIISAFVLSILMITAGFSQDIYPVIGVCTGVENSGMLKSNGYSYIEEGVQRFLIPLNDEQEFLEKLQAARQAAIPVKACNGFIPGNLKSVGPDANHEAILQYVETAFRRAQMAGVEIIVFGSGGSRSIPDGFSRLEARRQFIDLGRAMAPLAQKYNVMVVLEPLNTLEVNFINSVSEGAAIVQEINHPNFMLLADIYHMLMENEDPQDLITYAHLIRHVHVAEKQGRAAPGTHSEDLTPYYAALKRAGYTGRISIEGRWEDMPGQAAKAIETIQHQYKL
jgi:sugar phosphate isomerase/epimerase